MHESKNHDAFIRRSSDSINGAITIEQYYGIVAMACSLFLKTELRRKMEKRKQNERSFWGLNRIVSKKSTTFSTEYVLN